MKKLLLILLSLPMIGFGQGWEKKFLNPSYGSDIQQTSDGDGNATSTLNIPIYSNRKLEKMVDILG